MCVIEHDPKNEYENVQRRKVSLNYFVDQHDHQHLE